MSVTIDWVNKLVLSDASITDIIAFKNTIRGLEGDDIGMLYPPIITFKQLDLGAGAFQYGVDLINGYQLKFPNAGNYTVIGNINAYIVPVAGVFVDRTKSAAFATVAGSGGGGGLTAAEVWAHPARTLTDYSGVWSDSSAVAMAAKVTLATAILKNKTVTNPNNGVMTVYADDGVTPLLTAQLYETIDGSIAYRGNGAQRREALQ
jgi:hypothetical protein